MQVADAMQNYQAAAAHAEETGTKMSIEESPARCFVQERTSLLSAPAHVHPSSAVTSAVTSAMTSAVTSAMGMRGAALTL